MQDFISVKVHDGMFPSERLVIIDTVDGEISMFVLLTQVDEVTQMLKVIILERNGTHALVQIYAETGVEIIKVSCSIIKKRFIIEMDKGLR